MATKILTTIVQIKNYNINNIEQELIKKFKNVLRWSITKVENNLLDVSVTYEKT